MERLKRKREGERQRGRGEKLGEELMVRGTVRSDKEIGWIEGREEGTAFISPTPLLRQLSRC